MCIRSVASVTVAYNAEFRLARHIEAVLGQTRRLQEIIVVDNASSDGTVALLTERFPQVTVLRMTKNLGMAGAWAEGLKYAALDKGYDWVWTFDNDSVPEHNTLQQLLEERESLNGLCSKIGILAPLPVHPATGMYYPPLFWRDGFVKPSAELLDQEVWLADLVITSGSLIRREVIENIGLPRADFFMDFVDFEYCLRAKRHGYQIAVINEAKLVHEIGNSRKVRALGDERLWMNHDPWREYYQARNLAYLAWRLYPNVRTKRFVLRHQLKHCVGIMMFGTHKLLSIARVFHGFWDGFRHHLGIRLRPDDAAKCKSS